MTEQKKYLFKIACTELIDVDYWVEAATEAEALEKLEAGDIVVSKPGEITSNPNDEPLILSKEEIHE